MSELLTVEEALPKLKASRRWLQDQLRQKRIPYLKLGRRLYFLPADIESFVLSQRVPAKNAGGGPSAAAGVR